MSDLKVLIGQLLVAQNVMQPRYHDRDINRPDLRMVSLLSFSYLSSQEKNMPLRRPIRTEAMNQQANIVANLPINKLKEVYHLLLDPPMPEVCLISKDFYDSLF